MERGTTNDNRQLIDGVIDPDRDYVENYVAEACRHFKERGIDRNTVARAMVSQMFKMLEGNPFRSPLDEGVVKADVHFLWKIDNRVRCMTKAWEAGWARGMRENMPFNRAARRPAKPLPPRQAIPVPRADEGLLQFSHAMRRLGLFKGFFYTDKEIRARHRNRIAQAMRFRKEDVRQKHCKMLDDDLERVRWWYLTNRNRVTVRDDG